MRQLQIALFILGAASMVAAAFFIGDDMGDILWRLGIAFLFLDAVCIMLWPSAKR